MTPQIEALARAAGPAAFWAVGSADAVHAAHPGPEGDADPADAPDGWGTPVEAGDLTAVLALWPVIGRLVAQGELTLHTPLTAYGTAPSAGLPAGTTAHHLLTRGDGPAPLAALTRLAEHLADTPLADCAHSRVWQPLGMTRTRFAAGTLRTCPADLARFLRHLLSTADEPVPRAWTAESLRIRTGELTPSRGLLWHPAPAGVWTHHPPSGSGPGVWISPRQGRWAVLVPGAGAVAAGPPRAAFREAAFGSAPARAARGADVR
ncbi:hypothetical protein ACFY7H_21400 [Streptomyces sp. NPDC012794]|uniref:hypothetical protein n=1 Tax=Streptomyces sp. NPDC012794 TaxID=3364850 RepID=UPI003691F815